MRLRTALNSLVVVVWVLVIGSLAEFHTLEGSTGFILGIVACIPGFVLAGGGGQ